MKHYILIAIIFAAFLPCGSRGIGIARAQITSGVPCTYVLSMPQDYTGNLTASYNAERQEITGYPYLSLSKIRNDFYAVNYGCSLTLEYLRDNKHMFVITSLPRGRDGPFDITKDDIIDYSPIIQALYACHCSPEKGNPFCTNEELAEGFKDGAIPSFCVSSVSEAIPSAPAAPEDQPQCVAIGTRSEGWLWKDGLDYAQCAGCAAECRNVGTESEGWYSTCDGSFIVRDACQEASASSGFTDVPVAHPNATAIAYVKQKGIVQGYPDGTFHPDQSLNRAEFTKIVTLYKFGQQMIDACGTSMGFSDVSLTDWFGKYVCRAKDSHLIEGYTDGFFRPGRFINFAEAAKIIARADTFNAGDPPLPPETGVWYERYVRYLADRNAIPLSITSLDQLVSRGEMAEMIYRLKAGVTTKPSGTYEDFVVRSNIFAGWERNEHPMGLPLSYTYPPGWQIDSKGTVQTGSVSTSHATFDVREERELAGLSPQAASSRDGSFQTIESQGPVTIAGRSGYRLRGWGISGGRSIAQEKTFVAYDGRMFSVTFIDWNLSGNVESSDLYGTYEQMLSSLTFSAS